MQKLTGPPREAFTAGQVLDLLTASASVDIVPGCDLLDGNLAVVGDLTPVLVDGTIKRAMANTIHGTCSLTLAEELAWGRDLVRPYVVMSAPGTWEVVQTTDTGSQVVTVPRSARFNLGVFTLQTPKRTYGETPPEYKCAGQDRLALLDRQVGDSYEVAAGTEYLTAIRQVIADAGLTGVLLDGDATGKTLPATRVWPFDAAGAGGGKGVTWLRIVNDLLAAINYRGVWCDENGLYRGTAYQPPADRATELVLDEDVRTTLQAAGRERTRDLWQAPNVWVFVQSNRPEGSAAPVEGDGLYTVVNQSDGPTSIDARNGLRWVARYDLDVADQVTLVDAGDRQVAADRAVATTWAIGTAPIPTAGHADLFELVVEGIGRRVEATGWRFPLDGSDMKWQFREVA